MGWEGRVWLVEQLTRITINASKKSATSRILGALFFGPIFLVMVWGLTVVFCLFSIVSNVVLLVVKLIGNVFGAIYMLLDITVLGIYFIYKMVIKNEKVNR